MNDRMDSSLREALETRAIRTLVAAHAAVLTDEDRRLIARHMAEVEQLLLVCVGIVRRAVERGGR